jgi:hypothetical protein
LNAHVYLNYIKQFNFYPTDNTGSVRSGDHAVNNAQENNRDVLCKS